jgi:signal transduction histidine kinase
MFRTSFAKYLSAFILIIFLSFIFLSGIITVIIHLDMTREKEGKLEKVSDSFADQIEGETFDDFKSFVTESEDLLIAVEPLVSYDNQLEVIVTDDTGAVLLTTYTEFDNNDYAESDIIIYNGVNDIGRLEINAIFDTIEVANSSGEKENYLYHEGSLGGFTKDRSLVYGKEIVKDGEKIGYVFAFSSTIREDSVITVVRKAVTNSCVVVMIAAVLASYIMTERLVRPLRTITDIAKNYGKGDFSERIPIEGDDEVSDLASALNNMADSLDSLEKMRNSFLANISHDLRTPMTTISGFIDGITSGAIPEDKHEYYLGVISAEVHRLSRLVTQLLDVSRLESGERKFNFTNFDIAEMARIILISFEQRINSKSLDVGFESDNDEIYVIADEDAIYQVLYNLCHNAIKFSCDGGKFIIRIGMNADKKVQVSVFDEGQGISREDTKMVFDRFFKTDQSRGLDKNGVGLGLYISKTIMDAHDEKIWVESEEDKNCEFFFTLKPGVAPQKRGSGIVDGELLD